ncbi:MAG: tRNA lysidine(34) synthetase TilS [Clostridia bacterium]|nr:tRNA lysidine(34) synthetase TilS [Clostridia bacterium]
MICKVINTVENYRLFEGVRSVAVGVSGGADSMCLLHILSSLKDKYGIILKAVHVNHNLRGDEALRDEKLVRDYCQENGIELTVHSVNVAVLSEKLGLGTEECGRKVRYECFEKANCDAVAVAHSLSDSIETTVYNLLRGTGIKGLCGIPAKREPNIIRPLITCTREEIEKYCCDEKVPYVTDSTNLADDYTRNYIRHNVIPTFERVNASFSSNISRTCSILSEENDFIHMSAKELIITSEVCGGFNAEMFASAHIAVRKRAILIILCDKMKKQPLYIHTDLVNKIIENRGGKVEISAGWYAKVENGVLFFDIEKIIKPWQTEFSDGKAKSPFGIYSLSTADSDYEKTGAFDGAKIKGQLILSSRREGDKFTFIKRKVSKSLKKLFNEMDIPVIERGKIAVLRDDENIVWVEGVGVNASYIPDGNSDKIFVIKKDD